MELKRFYGALVVLAVGGGGALWWMARAPKDQGGATLAIPTAADSAFAGYVLGTDAAPVEIVEYADFQCPACAHFAILTGPDVRSRLVETGRVRWVFRDFPLPMHDKTRAAHLAAACADEQGKFWEMHDQLFYNQSAWSAGGSPERKFRDYARAVGLEMGRFDACVDVQRYAARIQASVARGGAEGVASTPSFVIGNRIYSGSLPYDRLRAIVDSLSPPPKP